MVDDTMKIFNSFNFLWLWLFAWRERERAAKEKAEATIINIERLLAMGEILNNSIGQTLHDTKRLSNSRSTRPK